MFSCLYPCVLERVYPERKVNFCIGKTLAMNVNGKNKDYHEAIGMKVSSNKNKSNDDTPGLKLWEGTLFMVSLWKLPFYEGSEWKYVIK